MHPSPSGPHLRAEDPPKMYRVVLFNVGRYTRERVPGPGRRGPWSTSVHAGGVENRDFHPLRSAKTIKLPPYGRVTLHFHDHGLAHDRWVPLRPTSPRAVNEAHRYLQDGKEGLTAMTLNKRYCRWVNERELVIVSGAGMVR